MEIVMNNQMIVSKTEALSARRALLEKEKAFTRQRYELARAKLLLSLGLM
jgi:predicted dithiol-disulfide oxidoreductase (DUF899 family)